MTESKVGGLEVEGGVLQQLSTGHPILAICAFPALET